MRNFDFAPLYRSTIGFDRLVSLINQLETMEHQGQSYPPYNIEKVSESSYRISLAVAGFSEGELSIETRENTLVVRGDRKADAGAGKAEFLFQGIAARQFERRFQLADYVRATGAQLENGLLHIELVREIPEAMKPRQITIGAGKSGLRTIEQHAA